MANLATVAVAEIAMDVDHKVLWVEQYPFKRKGAVGETFIRDSKTYRILASDFVLGRHGCGLLETIVHCDATVRVDHGEGQ